MTCNKLKLNEDKTELLIIGSPFNSKCLPEVVLTMGHSVIRPSESTRNLGVYFDGTLSMISHITHLCDIVRFIYAIFQKSRKFFVQNTCHHAVRGLIMSRLD